MSTSAVSVAADLAWADQVWLATRWHTYITVSKRSAREQLRTHGRFIDAERTITVAGGARTNVLILDARCSACGQGRS